VEVIGGGFIYVNIPAFYILNEGEHGISVRISIL
jgi:hypothetical protein